MAEILSIAKPAPEPAPVWAGGFVSTPTSQDIMRSLDLLQVMPGGAATMIAGAPGIGKTETLRAFGTANRQKVVHVVATKGETSPWNVAVSLHRACASYSSDSAGRGLADFRETVSRYFRPGDILIVDEAQHLAERGRNRKAGAGLEWLRQFSEENGNQLVLAGDLSLASAVATLGQLQSRMRRPVVIRAAQRGDVSAIADRAGVTDAAAIRALVAVARRPGALRNVDNVLRMARLFAGDDALTAAPIMAAIADLGYAPKGGRT